MPPNPAPRESDLTLAAYDSPIGRLTLAALEGSLVGLWARGQRFFGCPFGLDEAAARSAEDLTPLGGGAGIIAREGRDEADAAALNAATRWLDGYFEGRNPAPDLVPIAPRGSDFQRRVWAAMSAIPYGATLTYGGLAERLIQEGTPGSARAVGGAVARNPLLLILPCHRVVAARGQGGYAAGETAKSWLLAHEAATSPSASIGQPTGWPLTPPGATTAS